MPLASQTPLQGEGIFYRPLTLHIVGLVLIVGGACFYERDFGKDVSPETIVQGTGGVYDIVRAFLFGPGLLALGVAAAWRLQTAGQDFEARVGTAGLLVSTAVGVFLARIGSPPWWDSIQMVLIVLGCVSLAGALLVVLPPFPRRLVVSLLVLIHFGNILVAVTSVPPPNAPAAWLSVQAWSYFYRPYASFMYLNNAYHFYSPDPGPPTLAWFYIRYSDDSGRWIKLPSRSDPVPMHYQRLLALTESINVINRATPPNYSELATRRQIAGKAYEPEIPLPLNLPPNVCYQPPELYSKKMINAYALYVSRHWPHPDDNPEATVKTVKAYRLVHSIISAAEMARGINPDEKLYDFPYFMGEFDAEGNMLDEHDPFLYWLIPIMREPKPPTPGKIQTSEIVVKDYLQLHATGRLVVEER